MILSGLFAMRYDRLGECCRIAVIPIDLPCYEEFRYVREGSSGSHSPLTVAIWAFLAPIMAFVITPCAASTESRPPDLRLVRVVHSFTGRVLLEASHPRLGQVRVFLLKQWTGIK